MGLAFNAKFVSKCANGHTVRTDDLIAYNNDNDILCTKCPEFATRSSAHGAPEGSLKFCPDCHMEIAMSGKHDCW